MKKTILSISTAIFLFSGCAIEQQALKTKDNIMTPVDKSVVVVEEKYEDITNFFGKMIDTITLETNSLKANLVDNSFSQLLLDDAYILEHRNSLIIWDSGNSNNVDNILKKYLKVKNLKLNYKNLLTKDKLKLLNDYYFEKAENAFKKELNKLIKKPRKDPYLSNRENISRFNKYNLKILKATNVWKRDLSKIKKIVLEKSLSTLYGKPKLKIINYSPFLGRLYVEVYSQRNGFKQKAYLKLNKDLAKIIEKKKLNPSIYYKLMDNSFELHGASIKIQNKPFLVYLSDEKYISENKIILNHKELDLESESIKYNEIAKDVTPPDWFNKLNENDGIIIGYGYATSFENAKAKAIESISQTISVEVKSDSTIEKQMSGDIVSKNIKKKIDIKSSKKRLEGIKDKKSEIKDGLHFVAVEYKKVK